MIHLCIVQTILYIIYDGAVWQSGFDMNDKDSLPQTHVIDNDEHVETTSLDKSSENSTVIGKK